MNKNELTQILSEFLKNKTNRLFLFALISAITLAIIYQLSNKEVPPAHEPIANQTADTFIPEGYVLVPIDISNASSLSAMIGDFAMIDLYSFDTEKHMKGAKIASYVKLIRAPLDPNQYAVLVEEEASTKLMDFPGPFFVVIKHRSNSKIAEIKTKKKKSSVEVQYFN